jgi:hypothetical protein
MPEPLFQDMDSNAKYDRVNKPYFQDVPIGYYESDRRVKGEMKLFGDGYFDLEAGLV